jgi:hypothetical protein
VAPYAASPIPLGGRLPESVGMHSLCTHNHTLALAGRRELDARGGDGYVVRLWWDPASGRVAVTVAHAATGLELELPVRDGQAPLEVFRHPFAYAGETR